MMSSKPMWLKQAHAMFGHLLVDETPIWCDGKSLITSRRLIETKGIRKPEIAFDIPLNQIERVEYKYNLREYGIKIFVIGKGPYLLKNKTKLQMSSFTRTLDAVQSGEARVLIQESTQIGLDISDGGKTVVQGKGGEMGQDSLVTQEFDDMTGDARYYGPEYQLIGPVGLFGGSKIPSVTAKPVPSSDLVIIQPAAIIDDSGFTSYWWAFKAVSAERQLFGDVSNLLTLVDGRRSTWESLEPMDSVLDNGDLLEVVMFQMDENFFKEGHSSTVLKIRVLNQDFEIVSSFKEALGQLLAVAGQNQKQGFSDVIRDDQASSQATDTYGTHPSGDIRADISERGPRRLDF